MTAGGDKAEFSVTRIAEITNFMKTAMISVQERCKDTANKGRNTARQYLVSDKVGLILCQIKLNGRPSKIQG